MKHIANLILVLIIFFACGQQKDYTIIGTFNGETQEEWVYLGKFMGGELIGDSARIDNGRFVFKGRAGFPEVFGLSFNPANNPEVFPFFLEAGELIIEIDLNDWYSGSTISGGKANKEYQEVHLFRMENFVNNIWELNAKRLEAEQPDRKLIDQQISDLWEADQLFQLGYIKNNPGSPVSIFLLAFFYPNMPVDELAETLAIFSPEVQKTDIFKDISKYLNNQIDLQQFTPALFVGDRIEELNIEFNEAVIFQTIAEQNPGKAILVNIWGSWCNPCKKEFPYIRQIQKDFENQELAFVFVCVMSQKEDWLELVANENLKGQHFLLSKELSNRLFEETGSRAVPTYLIIDKTGALVNPNAPRPSDAKLRAQLAELVD
jgi:thiol-disulfide isomerase/thioredoxin